jgi:hypothetical protein
MKNGRGVILLRELAGREARLLYLLFPDLEGLFLSTVEDCGDSVRIVARTMRSCRSAVGPGP